MHNKPDVKARIERLREAMKQSETTLIDIFSFAANAALQDAAIAHALLRHMSDIVQEHADNGIPDMDYADILCDGIVRTFITGDDNGKYPGGDIIGDETSAIDFLGNMTDHLMALQDPQVLAAANAPTHAAH